MARLLILAVAMAIALQGETSAQVQTSAVDLKSALSGLRAGVNALPQASRSTRLENAVTWLEGRAASTNPADVSDEYVRALQRAAALLQQRPAPDVVEDVTADLEAKVEHCRALGIGMGGLVSLTVNTLRDGRPVSNLRVQALLKFYERLKDIEPRTFLRVSSPTAMALEPGRYWVWALDPAKGTTSERVLLAVTGEKELVFDLQIR